MVGDIGHELAQRQARRHEETTAASTGAHRSSTATAQAEVIIRFECPRCGGPDVKPDPDHAPG
jgi:hypothetical protein